MAVKKNLVIIESPTKAHTIQECLGSNYKVIASKGHVRDLPKSTLGIDIENGFEPHYINIRGKGDTIKELKKEAKKAGKVFLATDPDREGEAISWHLASVLGIAPEDAQRVTFNELTKNVIKTSIKNPRAIDMDLVNAQQTRRIIDRIVGYKLSPLLWRRVQNGLSAGRVQSVATRLVVEREEEINSFVPVEYWTVSADLKCGNGNVQVKYTGESDGSGAIRISDGDFAKKIAADTDGKSVKVISVKHAEKEKNPAPPFTTSTMLQEASRRLGFQAARTMATAQELYEGISLGANLGGTQGLITYMRTDSVRVNPEAQEAAREFIAGKYGEKYVPESPRQYKSRAGAQDAHEAIKPSRVDLVPTEIKKLLTPDQFKLYKLIWERFLASQMASAKLDTLSVDFEAGTHRFRTGGYSVAFQGYMALYEESSDEAPSDEDADNIKNIRLPEMKEGSELACTKAEASSHFTEPAARYTEASLIKTLEDMGIGRPSTIPPTITTITARKYVKRDAKSLVPTNLGTLTTRLMCEDFGDIVDYRFTAQLEEKLDGIESGEDSMDELLRHFWDGFRPELEESEKKDAEDKQNLAEETDIICEKCGARMIVRTSRRNVRFAACPNYPKCRNTKTLDSNGDVQVKAAPVVAEFKCESCGGDMVERSGPYGKFYACVNYPTCKFIKSFEEDTGVACPKCSGRILVRHGRKGNIFYSCEHYPDCDFSTWDLPTNEKCPDCGGMLFRKKGKNPGLICRNDECKYFKADEKPEGYMPDSFADTDLPVMPEDFEMAPPPSDADIN